MVTKGQRKVAQTSPGFTRTTVTGDGVRGRRDRGAFYGKSRKDIVWGQGPRRDFDQAGVTDLLEMQKQLNAALRRQARLAKLDVSEVRSTEAERLRQVNSQLVAGTVRGSDGYNPFAHRSINEAQAVSEAMIRAQGTRWARGNPDPKPSGPAPKNKPIRSALHRQFPTDSVVTVPQTRLGVLSGPLAPDFRRARVRGYHGPPNRWLRGAAARRSIDRLRQKGRLSPLWTGELSVFDRESPLRYAVTACTAIKTAVRHGFFGERLYNVDLDSKVHVGQATSVPRLKYGRWPRDHTGGLAWPTYPTLNESWEMMMRKKLPHHILSPTAVKSLPEKIPRSQVLPGTAVRVVHHFVRGIRSDTPVPANWLGFFEYRWGFLILKRHGKLPTGLVRLLTSLWKRDITKMFLACPIAYSEALLRLPKSKFYVLFGFAASRPEKGPKGPRTGRRELRRLLNRPNASIIESYDGSDESLNQSSGGLRLY